MSLLETFISNNLAIDIQGFRYKLDMNSGLYYPLDLPPSLVTRKTWGYELIDPEKSTTQYLTKWLVFTTVQVHSSLHYHKKKNEFFYVIFAGEPSHLHNYNLDKKEWATPLALSQGDEVFTPAESVHMFSIGEKGPTYIDVEGTGGNLILLEVSFFAENFKTFKELLEADKNDNVKLFPAGVMNSVVFSLPMIADVLSGAPKQITPEPEDHGDDLLV